MFHKDVGVRGDVRRAQRQDAEDHLPIFVHPEILALSTLLVRLLLTTSASAIVVDFREVRALTD
jgi:hypothetical protein